MLYKVDEILNHKNPINLFCNVNDLKENANILANLSSEQQEELAAKIFVNASAQEFSTLAKAVTTLTNADNNSFFLLLKEFIQKLRQIDEDDEQAYPFMYHADAKGILDFILDNEDALTPFCTNHPTFINLLVEQKGVDLANKLILDIPPNKRDRVAKAINSFFPNTSFSKLLSEGLQKVIPHLNKLRGPYPEDFFKQEPDNNLINKYSTAFYLYIKTHEKHLADLLELVECSDTKDKIINYLKLLSKEILIPNNCFANIATRMGKPFDTQEIDENPETTETQKTFAVFSDKLESANASCNYPGNSHTFFQIQRTNSNDNLQQELEEESYWDKLLSFSLID